MATQQVDEGQRRQMIAEAAYFRAERRGFGRDPHADWIEAEAEVDARLRQMTDDGADLLEQLENRLADAAQSMRSFHQKLAAMKAGARSEWEQDLERFTALRDAFEKKLEEIREQGHHASEKAKEQAEEIWQDIADLRDRFLSGSRAKNLPDEADPSSPSRRVRKQQRR